ncbi:hypothetical protein MSG28_004179 [Choristoneura fumiferana]|uniref:Uncharacterized protein n=1 Tax=Choristoneura fumiferana TaxID=7141 RepID=A0ACC0KIE9_CHOFU|nr:hypothetical protein MSG28_004179 [Choristoneura fumiferana]
MCLHVRLLCDALWWPLLMRCARAARTYDDDYEQAGPAPAEEERRGSVSNWFSSLRRGGRRRRDEPAPSNYGSLGRRKDGTQPRGKTRSAWDLTTVSKLIEGLYVAPPPTWHSSNHAA